MQQYLDSLVENPVPTAEEILHYIKEHRNQCGIVYCSTRNNVDEVYELLCQNGIGAARYHAGMSKDADIPLLYNKRSFPEAAYSHAPEWLLPPLLSTPFSTLYSQLKTY